ncbi:MAG: tyrosine-type recombinase/integrase [Sarcina sp.]
MDIKLEIEKFEKSLKGKSQNTIYNYCLDIKQFVNWLENRELINDLIEDYKNEIIEKYQIKTVNRKCNSLNAYLEFKNISYHVKSEKIQTQTLIDDMMTNDDIVRILRQIKKFDDKRAEAIILTLFYTGARVSEMLQIKVKDIGKDEIMIKGKGSKYRKILIPKKLNEALKNYIEQERLDTSEYVFNGERGRITRNTVLIILKKYAGLSRMKKDKVSPHAVRHLYTKNLVDLNVSYSAIKQLLGHALTTTDIYMQLSKKELLRIINNIKLDTKEVLKKKKAKVGK